jgi:hypothetical protein
LSTASGGGTGGPSADPLLRAERPTEEPAAAVGPVAAVGPTADEPIAGGALALEDDPGPSFRLLATALPYTDAQLIVALRARLGELSGRADQLEGQVLDAQARLGALVKAVRERAEEGERALVATLSLWAQGEAAAIIKDASRRAAELRAGLNTPADVGKGTSPDLRTLEELLVTHFELHENLVRLVAEMALSN